MNSPPPAPPSAPTSVWSPLRFPLFRVMWVAMTISNIGTWMNEVAVTWLMATLAPSNLMIALIQTATTLPFFLLAYPAGALGDIFNRRILLLVLHLWMLLSAVLLVALTQQGLTTAWWLLILTFALGAGNAMMRPPWSANIPTFAPREHLSNAVTLNSLSTNISKAIGPAIGGLLIAASGPALVFGLNALSFVAVIIALVTRHPRVATTSSALPVERFFTAMKSGLRYTRHEPRMQAVLIRCGVCFLFVSAFWSLMPVIVIRDLGASAQTYGLLIGTTGFGSIIGATALPALRRRWSHNRQFDASALVFALALFAIAFTSHYALLAALATLVGLCWIVMFSTIIVTAQLITPGWVLARALSVVMLVYGGATATGAALWGHLSDLFDVRTSLLIAAPGVLISLLLSRRYPIPQERARAPATALPSPEPDYFTRIRPAAGPVMVMVEYHIDAVRRAEFLALMAQAHLLRKRTGAFYWELFVEPARPDCYLETFLVESWLDYLRQRERTGDSERAIDDQLAASARQAPVVRHYVARRQ